MQTYNVIVKQITNGWIVMTDHPDDPKLGQTFYPTKREALKAASNFFDNELEVLAAEIQ